MSTSATKEASLLGLPRELRLRIFDFVLASDLQLRIINQWRHPRSRGSGFSSVPDINDDAVLVYPWVNLALTCKKLSVELRAFMRESSFLADRCHLTYVLDLDARSLGETLGAVTWRQLPCTPGQVQYVKAYYNASSGLLPYGDGGPSAITRSLYQTLNHLIHCGPRFDAKRPLKQAMHLKKLTVVVESRGESRGRVVIRPGETDAEAVFRDLCNIVRRIVNTGVLRGFVDEIQLSTVDRKSKTWRPAEIDGHGIPGSWTGYGFEWGMSSCQ